MPTNPEPTQLPLAIGWRRSSRFADLVMGPNAEAFALLQGLSRGNPAGMAPCGAQRSSPQCIYLWGAAATGKTHLLQACAGGAADSGLTVAYVPLAARRELELEAEMLGGLDRLDIVCLDDAHEVAGRADWELAIFGLYQRLVAADGYLLASSNRSPAAAGFALADLAFAPRLRSGAAPAGPR